MLFHSIIRLPLLAGEKEKGGGEGHMSPASGTEMRAKETRNESKRDLVLRTWEQKRPISPFIVCMNARGAARTPDQTSHRERGFERGKRAGWGRERVCVCVCAYVYLLCIRKTKVQQKKQKETKRTNKPRKKVSVFTLFRFYPKKGKNGKRNLGNKMTEAVEFIPILRTVWQSLLFPHFFGGGGK
jgi:hypothetical protein